MPTLVLLWLHRLAAIPGIGGMIFVGGVLAPVAREMGAAQRAGVLRRAGVRLGLVGWVCIGVLLVTCP